MKVWKIIFLSKWVICMFHVNLPGCISRELFSVKNLIRFFGLMSCELELRWRIHDFGKEAFHCAVDS